MKSFGKLLKYLKPYWKAALIAPLFMVFEVFFDLLQPMLMQRIIDVGIASGDASYILTTGLLMIFVAVLGAFAGIGCVIFSTIAAQSFGADLRNDLFKKVQSLSYSNLDKLETGHLVTRLTDDVNQAQNLVMNMLRLLVRSPFLLIGALVMAYVTSPELAPIVLVVVPILLVVLGIIIKMTFPMFKKVQTKLDKVNATLQENLSGIRVVKAFVRKDYEIQRFKDFNGELTDVNIQASRRVALIFPFILLILNLGVVAVLWIGGLEVSYGNIEVGQIMAFINYLMQIMASLMIIGMVLMSVSKAEASSSRIIEVFGEEPAVRNPENPLADRPIRGDITFNDVTFSFDGSEGDPVLKNLNLDIRSGETIAILGATGSGKSTLVQLIPRLYEATSGTITIDGIDIKAYDKDFLRRNIGLVHQKALLFSGSIENNIRYGKKEATDEEIRTAVEISQSAEFIDTFEQGLNTSVSQKGGNLSGGQKQRLSMARALVRKPPIIIFDDSTSAVDVQSEAKIQKGLKENLGHSTVIYVAQKITSIIDADKIIVLDDGKISGIGTHESLLANNPIYQDIFDSQIGREGVNHVN